MRWLIPLLLVPAQAFAADGAVLASAANLPARAQELRDKGVDAAEVTSALDSLREAKIPAGDAAKVLGDTVPLVEKHGPIEGFGGFVKEKVGEGLRGEDLAAAIKTAHEKGGKGPADGDKPAPKPTTDKPDPEPARPTNPSPAPGKLVRPGSGGTRPGTAPAPTPRPGTAPAPTPKPGRITRPGSGN